MITVIFQHNPLDKTDNIAVQMEGGKSVTQILQQTFTPNFKDFSSPTICQLNGKYILRANWSVTQVRDGDTLTFASLVQDPVTAFYVVVAVIAIGSAIYAYSNMPKPTETNIPGADPTYSLAGHKNQNKLGQPIEVCYGRNYVYGAIAARSYNIYKGNDQYLFSLFCLGQGEFDIHGVYIEDTAIENFQDVTYEVYGPGEQVTLFPDNVLDSLEVSEIELPGLNESGGNVELGPFITNPSQTTVNRIEIDYAFSSGLYKANDKGGLDTLIIKAEFEYREIDNDGNTIGPWTPFLTVSKEMATTTPQRFTGGADVTPGRYMVRGMRTNNKDNAHTSGNTLVWQKLRVFMPDVRDYGNVTLLALRAKADNNLNSSAQTSVNVDCTRKLPIYDTITKTWSAPQTTRSAVWALCDIFRSKYGANLTDNYLSLDQLASMDSELASRGDSFDWVFDRNITIWEAAKKVARAVRSVPRLPGSRVTMVRDVPQTLPKGVFTMDNITKGSFAWDFQFFEVNEKDSLRIEYADITTGQIETVLCQLPGGSADNVEEMRLEGVNNRAQAYREGMYILASKYYLRESVSFTTGLEGHIPSYGDVIAVSYDIPLWGISGFVEAVQKVSNDSYNVTLLDPVEFNGTEAHYIVFRRGDGSAGGPYQCTRIDDYTVNIVSSTVPITVRDNVEAPMFQFGKGDNWSKICRVTEINPSTKEDVSIKAVVYKQIIHSFDDLPTPGYGDTGRGVVIPALPVVTGLKVNILPNQANRVQITWTPALGAHSYVVQLSSDGVSWVTVTTTSSTVYSTEVLSERLFVRVAGINQGQGPWALWEGDVGSETEAPGIVQNLKLVTPFTGKQFTVSWNQIINADYYEIEILRKSDAATLRKINNTSLTYTYTSDDARADGANSRGFIVLVTAVNGIGRSSMWANLSVSNPVPPKVTGLVATFRNVDRYSANYDLEWPRSSDPDTVGYKVWQMYSSSSTPNPTKPTWTLIDNYLNLEIRMTQAWEPYPGDQGEPFSYSEDTWYQVGAYDPWTDEMVLSDVLFIAGRRGPY